MKSFLTIVFFLLGTATALAATGRTMHVAVKEGPLRETPSPFGRILILLPYGRAVAVLQEQPPWVRVRDTAGGTAGWMHGSALSSRKVELQAGAGKVGTAASADEVTLAGKGFNAQVEKEFRNRNRDLDFTWIDRMERYAVTPEQVRDFVRQGGLQGGSDGH